MFSFATFKRSQLRAGNLIAGL